MNSSLWSPEDIAYLINHWRAGESAAQIAKAFHGRHSRSAVVGKADRLRKEGFALDSRPSSMNRGWEHRTKPFIPRLPKHQGEPIPAARVLELAPIGLIGEFETGMTTCRWPFDTGKPGVYRWCGRPGFPWCDAHKALAWPNGKSSKSQGT